LSRGHRCNQDRITTMEPTLKDKLSFFKQIESLRHEDDDDEAIDVEEELHREKSRAFTSASRKEPGLKSQSTFPGITRPSGPLFSRRTASEPIPAPQSTTEVIVVEDNLQPTKTRVRNPSGLRAVANADDTAIPDSTKRAGTQPSRRIAHPQLRKNLRSSTLVENSPSVAMGRRKRSSRLNMAPEAQQCFKGLSFFYIPNDDIAQVRKQRITKAQEHGAEWVRELTAATHVIVDDKFTYGDIEKTLNSTPGSLQKTIVKESYPLDCIKYYRLVNPNQNQYQVPGFPQEEPAPTEAPEPSQPLDTPLLLEQRSQHQLRNSRVQPDATPPRSQDSSQRSTHLPAGKVITASQLGDQGEITVQEDHTTEVDAEIRHVYSQNQRRGRATDVSEDELSQFITKMREKPGLGFILGSDDEVDGTRPSSASSTFDSSGGSNGEAASSEDERRQKRSRPSKKTSKGEPGWQDRFARMQGGTKGGKMDDNPNADTIAILQQMCDYYTEIHDQWRIRAYRQAISALRREETKITTAREAKEIEGIGSRIADKIEEIVKTGRLKRLEAAQEDPDHQVFKLFLGIYGAGGSITKKWVARGHRTLEDLVEKENLNDKQRIGIKYYEDLNTRIPRAEVEALARCVKRTAAQIDPRVELLIGGSYRRGSDSSGDIDFIITRKGTTSSGELKGFFDKLIQKLVGDEFLTVNLAKSSREDGTKWHGCCVLPKDDFPGDKAEYKLIWRRIDFLLVPETEFGAALLYFTGNDLFNRSIRLLANKKGMRLNQRGLYRYVMRGDGGDKYNEGELVEGRDEKKIFEALGVKWRGPHERWC
jgi:DNA polymerase IV